MTGATTVLAPRPLRLVSATGSRATALSLHCLAETSFRVGAALARSLVRSPPRE